MKWFQGLRHPWDGHDDHSHGHGHGHEVVPSDPVNLQSFFHVTFDGFYIFPLVFLVYFSCIILLRVS